MKLNRILVKAPEALMSSEIDLCKTGDPLTRVCLTGTTGSMLTGVLRDLYIRLINLEHNPEYKILCRGVPKPDDFRLPDTDMFKRNTVVLIPAVKDHLLFRKPLEEIWSHTEKATAVSLNKIRKMFESITGLGLMPFCKYEDPVVLLQGRKLTLVDLIQYEEGLAILLHKLALMTLHVYEESIILIERPEAGISPEYQSNFITEILSLFQDNQVIVTTQSPFILSAMPDNSIHKISLADGDKIVEYPSESTEVYGRDPNDIYSNFLGVDVYPVYVVELINKIEALRLEKPYKRDVISQLIIELSGLVGSEDPKFKKLSDSHIRTLDRLAEIDKVRKQGSDPCFL